jgi:hypothetical protein
MAGQELTDPRLIAEFNDRQAAADAGLDFDKISRSDQYQQTLENNLKFGRLSGFAGVGSTENEGSTGNSWFRGQFGSTLEGAAQGITRLGNATEKAVGLDPNQGALGGEGMFSDAAVDYNDAQARINAMRHQQGRQARGYTGPDLAQMAGSLMTPVPGGGGKGIVGGALHAAGTGAVLSGLQPVDDTSKDDFWTQKAMQIASGAGTGAAVGTALKVPGVIGSALGSRAADVAQNVDRFGRLGLTPSLAETSPSRGIQQVAKGLSGTLVGGSIAKRAAGTLSDLGGVVSDTADQISGGQTPSRFSLGQILKNGLEGFQDRFKKQAADNYEGVNDLVPDGTMVDMNDTVNAMRGPVNQFPSAPGLGAALSSPKLAKWANILSLPDNLGAKPLSFAEAQAMRSRIGDLIGAKPGELTDLPTGDLKRVYGALSESMKNALGDETTPARQAWDNASNFWQQGREHLDNVIQPLLNKPAGESMVDTIQNMIKQNGVGVQKVRQSLEPDDWDKVAGYMFGNLGQETPGAAGAAGQGFSIAKFLTDFNKLRQNPEAFNAAFGGTKYEPLAQRYQDIADIADQAKKSQEFVNKSQSANTAVNLGLLGGLITHPHITIPTVGSGYAGAGILANPTVARTVANMGRAYQAMGTTQPRTLTRYLMEQTAKLHGLGMQQIPGAAAIGVGRAIGGP